MWDVIVWLIQRHRKNAAKICRTKSKRLDFIRHTYCSNMAKSGMNPKTLQYLMGHSDIGVTLNTYTHLGLEDATDELRRMEDLENARKELEKNKEEKPVSQKMFRAI